MSLIIFLNSRKNDKILVANEGQTRKALVSAKQILIETTQVIFILA